MKHKLSAVLPKVARPAVTTRVVTEQEIEWFEAQLAGHHYLGAGPPVGITSAKSSKLKDV
jgi:hypothetical protein